MRSPTRAAPTSVRSSGLGARARQAPLPAFAVLEVGLPAVLGVQSAEQPPRYVPVSKVAQAKRTLQLTELTEPTVLEMGVRPTKLLKSDPISRAEMLTGDVSQVADQIVRLLRERSLV